MEKGNKRRLVFELLRERAKTSRAEIARVTGMSFPTAMKVVEEFLEKGLLEELEELEPGVGGGRKGHMLRFVPGAYRAVGVECEGQFAHVGLSDMVGNVLKRETIELGEFMHTRDLSPLADAVKRMQQAAGDSPVLGICIGFPANMNQKECAVVSCQTMEIETQTPFAQIFPTFCSSLDLPLYVENDANVACEGEAFLRRERCESSGSDNMLYIALGSGCGGAVRLDGKLRCGARCSSGEIGALLLHPAEGAPKREEMQDTLEGMVCIPALERKFGVTLREDVPLEEETVQKLCEYLAAPLSGAIYTMAMMLDIDLCVLSGIVPSILGPQLCAQIEERLNGAMPKGTAVRVEPSVDQDAGIIGAAATVFAHSLDALLGG
ncbi:MAG: ROK family protein [bacterium]|nr:ROK family protein [bacterium]